MIQDNNFDVSVWIFNEEFENDEVDWNNCLPYNSKWFLLSRVWVRAPEEQSTPTAEWE